MDLLFKKRMLMRNKPTMGMFKKAVPMGMQIAPSMMRQQLVGVGGAGIRKLIAPVSVGGIRRM
jgi:hypothetical protein